MNRWKMRCLVAASHLLLAGMWLAGTLFGIRYARFIVLDAAAKRAIKRGAIEKANTRARELLALAENYPEDWNYGNAVHHGHLVLGRVALALGDAERAKEELLAAGSTPGSPQLNSFGPNMCLAEELLRAGAREVVLQYFDLCGRFWKMERGRLAAWTADVNDGRIPAFGPNLLY